MKLALFFSLSLILHSAVLVIPVALNGRPPENAIAVTILPLEPGGELNGGGNQAAKTNSEARPPGRATSRGPANDGQENAVALPIEKIAADTPAPSNDKIIVAATGPSLANSANGSGEGFAAGNGARGNAFGSGASGSGNGNGEGFATGQTATLTQPRYRETPQPRYPESARREGKEGRVLLRVLVDEEGRTKAVEINSSSGHAHLDQAATEALKKWRFVPAQSGGKPVETWVKVPIDFQLSNAKP